MSETLYVRPLTASVCAQSFDCGNGSINTSLTCDAYYKHLAKKASTTEVALKTDAGFQIVAYCSLSVIMFGVAEEDEEEIAYPAVHIDIIGVNRDKQGRGYGTQLLRYIIRRVREFSQFACIRYVLLDAIKDRYTWYEERGFLVLNVEDLQNDESTIQMFMDLRDDSLLQSYFEEQGGEQDDTRN